VDRAGATALGLCRELDADGERLLRGLLSGCGPDGERLVKSSTEELRKRCVSPADAKSSRLVVHGMTFERVTSSRPKHLGLREVRHLRSSRRIRTAKSSARRWVSWVNAARRRTGRANATITCSFPDPSLPHSGCAHALPSCARASSLRWEGQCGRDVTEALSSVNVVEEQGREADAAADPLDDVFLDQRSDARAPGWVFDRRLHDEHVTRLSKPHSARSMTLGQLQSVAAYGDVSPGGRRETRVVAGECLRQ